MQTSKIAQTVTDLVNRRKLVSAQLMALDAEIAEIGRAVGATTELSPFPGASATGKSQVVKIDTRPDDKPPLRFRGKTAKLIISAADRTRDGYLRYKDVKALGRTAQSLVRDGIMVKAGPGRYAPSIEVRKALALG